MNSIPFFPNKKTEQPDVFASAEHFISTSSSNCGVMKKETERDIIIAIFCSVAIGYLSLFRFSRKALIFSLELEVEEELLISCDRRKV